MSHEILSLLGEELPRLGLGCMRLPMDENGAIDFVNAQQMIDYAMENGVNYFDTAYIYHDGESEKFLGKALKKYPRSSYYLADKLPVWLVRTKEDVSRLFNEQLERLGSDYFDFYLAHDLNSRTIKFFQETEAYDFLMEMKRKGKIKHLGLSCHDTPQALAGFLDTYSWEFCLLQINYVDWAMDIAREQYREVASRGLPVMIMEPVRGGFLADLPGKASEHLMAENPNRSQAGWALRWCRSLEGVSVILSGMSSMEQLMENVKTFRQENTPLSETEVLAYEKTIEELSRIKTVPCTACRYCSDCPSGVKISEIFTIYNKLKLLGSETTAKRSYRKLGCFDASACIECGACEEICPQGIKIISEIRKIDNELRI